MKVIIRKLNENDRTTALQLIYKDELRPEGIHEIGTKYWGAFIGNSLIGIIGCEYENEYGLLRSALVDKNYRGNRIAEQLTKVLLQSAREDKVEEVFLFSTEAGEYWTKLGFQRTDTYELIQKLRNAPQVKLFEKLGWLPSEVAYKYIL
jgi:N-acetylglutamate synthase-like GNAT family acetyltransferase